MRFAYLSAIAMLACTVDGRAAEPATDIGASRHAVAIAPEVTLFGNPDHPLFPRNPYVGASLSYAVRFRYVQGGVTALVHTPSIAAFAFVDGIVPMHRFEVGAGLGLGAAQLIGSDRFRGERGYYAEARASAAYVITGAIDLGVQAGLAFEVYRAGLLGGIIFRAAIRYRFG